MPEHGPTDPNRNSGGIQATRSISISQGEKVSINSDFGAALFQFDLEQTAFLHNPAGLTAMRDALGPQDIPKPE